MEDNIITVDFNKDKKGEMNLAGLEDFVDSLEWYSELSCTFLAAVKDVGEKLREEAGLSGVDFYVMNSGDLPFEFSDLLSCPNPTAILGGMDEIYSYMMTVTVEFVEDNDLVNDESIQYTAFARVFRAENKQKDEENVKVEIFDPDKEEWLPYDAMDDAGIPEELREIFSPSNPEDEWKADLLNSYMDEYETPTREEFEKILNNNRQIIELDHSLMDFTELWFLDRNNLCIEMYLQDGGRVIYKDGFYVLQAVLDGAVLQSVYRTKNMWEMRCVIDRFFNRACREDVIAIVPLSKDAFAIVKDCGDAMPYIFSNEREFLTKKEKKLLNRYIKEFTG